MARQHGAHRNPTYTQVAIAGGAINQLQDLSRWLIALLNGGGRRKQVIPMVPGTDAVDRPAERRARIRGWENSIDYGMGRWVSPT
jgi:hypothetical protein